jgi:hypothetical protein
VKLSYERTVQFGVSRHFADRRAGIASESGHLVKSGG